MTDLQWSGVNGNTATTGNCRSVDPRRLSNDWLRASVPVVAQLAVVVRTPAVDKSSLGESQHVGQTNRDVNDVFATHAFHGLRQLVIIVVSETMSWTIPLIFTPVPIMASLNYRLSLAQTASTNTNTKPTRCTQREQTSAEHGNLEDPDFELWTARSEA